MDRVYMYVRVFISVCMNRVYMCGVFIGVYAWMEFICISECLYVYACVKFICICKLFTSVYGFITNIRCIGMDFILVCTCISYIYTLEVGIDFFFFI